MFRDRCHRAYLLPLALSCRLNRSVPASLPLPIESQGRRRPPNANRSACLVGMATEILVRQQHVLEECVELMIRITNVIFGNSLHSPPRGPARAILYASQVVGRRTHRRGRDVQHLSTRKVRDSDACHRPPDGPGHNVLPIHGRIHRAPGRVRRSVFVAGARARRQTGSKWAVR